AQLPAPPTLTLFPYTPLFRSGEDRHVTPDRWHRPDSLAMVTRVLPVEQRVVHGLALLRKAHSPRRWPYRMDDDRFRGGNGPEAAIQEGELEIGVFPPRLLVALVEA